jgi:predicted metal-dependent hydrolase
MRGFFKRLTKKKLSTKNTKIYLDHKEDARHIILERVRYFSPVCGVSYNRVAIRNQKSRWGSCSSKKNLNFNYRLAYLPKHICDYVIVHELCHLKQMNHGPLFWQEVEKVIPNFQADVNELRQIERLLATNKTDLKELYTKSHFRESVSKNIVVN